MTLGVRGPVLLGLGLLLGSVFALAQPGPNIVLIVADDLGARDVGFMGSRYFETPHLDRFAAESVVFDQAYAAAANCAPSRACLLTGLNTPRHGIYTVGNADRGRAGTRRLVPAPNETDLAPRFDTLAERLRGAGYETITIGKWHLGPDPTAHGFEHNVAGNRAGSPPGGHFSPYTNPNLASGPDGEYLTDRLTDEALAFLDRRDRARPFLLYLPHYAVHTPLQAKADKIAKYTAKGAVDGVDHPTYGAMVESLDEGVGRLLAGLEAHGLRENTLVIFTSDNGGIAAVATQKPLRAGKGSYYEGGIRVPLAVRWPGRIPAGVRSEVPTTNLDMLPTLLEAAGVAYDASALDGISLLPHLRTGAAVAERPLFWHFPIYLQAYEPALDEGRDPLFRTRPGSVVRLGGWKLHEYFEDGGLELYHLPTDPGERINRADTNPARTREMAALLQAWRQGTGAPVPTERDPAWREPVAP
jgi:arylsulfatase A-like enzyme